MGNQKVKIWKIVSRKVSQSNQNKNRIRSRSQS